MANKVNLRELILNILLEIDKEGQYSHLVLRRASTVIWYFGVPWRNISIWKNKSGLLLPGSAKELWNTGSVWIMFWISFLRFRQKK